MTKTVTDLEIIEDLDWKVEQPCEHSQHNIDPDHSGPAYYLIHCVSPCGCHNLYFYICKSGYDLSPYMHCSRCGRAGGIWHRDDVWTVVGTVH